MRTPQNDIELAKLVNEQSKKIVSDVRIYKDFLTFCSHHFKRSFVDQISIMSQQPSATAVASSGFWKNILHRDILPNQEPIRTFNESPDCGNDEAFLYDVSQVSGSADDVKKLLWQFKQSDAKAIRNLYNLDGSGDFTDMDVLKIISKVPSEMYTKDIEDRISAYTDKHRKSYFRLCAAASCRIISERLQLNTAVTDMRGSDIWEAYGSYNPSDIITSAGKAADICRDILLNIEGEIKNERRKQQLTERTRNGQLSFGIDRIRMPNEKIPDTRKRVVDAGHDSQGRVSEIRQGAGRAGIRPLLEHTAATEEREVREGNRTSQGELRGNVQIKSTDNAAGKNHITESNVGKNYSDRECVRLRTDEDLNTSIADGDNSSSVFLSDNPTLEDLLNNEEQLTAATATEAEVQEQSSECDTAVEDFFFTAEPPVLGQKVNFKNNTAAIRLLRQLEIEDRAATPDEQEVLAKYVGWGGISQAFDENNTVWQNEYAELKNLLNEKEYVSARSSCTTSFYTPTYIISEIYEALKQFGFAGGKILDPAMGTSRFFCSRPEEFKNSCRLYGVEIDEISGKIAKFLTPSADIKICGFEQADYPDNFFDVAITNVPFGNIKLFDKRYDNRNFLIHDYFFAKTVDKVKPGGLIGFITSKGTLDKSNEAFRKYLFERCDLIGAVRLPSIAFLAANTEATSDIIFLQKRSVPNLQSSPYVGLSLTNAGIPINTYFAENPDMMLGKLEYTGMYGGEQITTLTADYPDTELKERLHSALSRLSAKYEMTAVEINEPTENDAVLAVNQIENFTYGIVDGKLYYRENSIMTPPKLSNTQSARLCDILPLRDCLMDLLQAQVSDIPDEDLAVKRENLNRLYDAFVEKHGNLNSKENVRVFSEDVHSSAVFALEEPKKDGGYTKARIFSYRTAAPVQPVRNVSSASDALAVCMNEKGKVDFEFMCSIYAKSEEEIREELSDKIFKEPKTGCWQTADEYLSGDVRAKLATAKIFAEQNDEFNQNIEALERALPDWLEAGDIYAPLGSSWIKREYYQQFIYELLGTPIWKRENIRYGSTSSKIKLTYNDFTSQWKISGKTSDTSVSATQVYGTERINAYQIIEDSLNLKDVVIKDAVDYTTQSGKTATKYVINAKQTAFAREKQKAIKDAFADWIFEDAVRREDLVATYNRLFNCIRERHYDGQGLTLPGLNPEIVLKPYQLNAVARIRSGNNTLLDHVVGAGKTYTMIAGAKEQLRLGMASKVLFVVPNHLTQQFGNDIYKLYPNTRALIATKKDFEKENRKCFLSRIALSDAEMIVIGHSQYEKLTMSPEYRAEQIKKEIDQISDAIRRLKEENGERYSVKQFEVMKKNLETKMLKLFSGDDKKDRMLTFEQLGINSLFVDEAHYYKNCAVFSKMQNVAGINNTNSAKASDMLMKTRFLQENGGIVTFATGTPISNSMAEMYVMQRYLQNNLLLDKGLKHFDSWAATFGEVVASMELAPESGYRIRTRFSKFHNLPELMQMYKQTADVQTAEMLKLPVPALVGGKPEVVACEPSEELENFMEESIERVKKIRNREVSPDKDNMLKFTGDAKKAGLDMRLISPENSFDENGKLAACANKVYEQYLASREINGSQLIFCDTSTPNSDKFDVYTDMKRLLVLKGIPEEQITFIHSAKNESQKEEIFAKVRSGRISVLMGSTQKMGAGTNVQERLVALHHLDCPYRPSDIEQREGRILRQGNMNSTVSIYRYVTKRSFDAYLWNIVETKQKFISQIRCGSSAMRSCEDLDEAVLSYAEAQAIATGDPRVKEKIEIDADVARLQLLKSRHLNEHYRYENQLKDYPEKIAAAQKRLAGLKCDSEIAAKYSDKEFSIKIGERWYEERTKAAEKIIAFKNMIPNEIGKKTDIGELCGFKVSLKKGAFEDKIVLSANSTYETEFEPAGGHYNVIRLENLIKSIPDKIQTAENVLRELVEAEKTARENVDKPFQMEDELKQKIKRQSELNAELQIKNDDSVIPENADADETERSSEWEAECCD